MPIASTGIRIVAWVNHHWRECGAGRWDWSSLGYEHRHILVEEGGVVKQGTVWRGSSASAPIEISFGDLRGGKEVAALMARRRLEGMEPSYYYSGGMAMLDINYQGHKIKFGFGGKANVLTSHVTEGDPPKDLVALALPAVGVDELVAKIDEVIASELEWRYNLAQLWGLVTEETPQVYL